MKKYLYIILLACCCNTLKAQANMSVDGLKIGDKVPENVTGNIINYSSQSIQVADFKGKLLILDFWATSCVACIESMPKLAALQKQFGDKIQILCVDYEQKDRVLNFFKSKRGGTIPKLPVVWDDTLFKKLFPHQYLPFVVWINDGIYRAATEGDYLTASNINSIIQNKSGQLNQKKILFDFSYKEPVTITRLDSRLESTRPIYGINLTGYIPGLISRAGTEKDSLNNTKRKFFINHPIINLFVAVLNSPLPLIPNRRILEVNNPADYIFNPKANYNDSWMAAHAYTIEAKLPLNTNNSDFNEQLKLVLKDFLHLNGRIETREMDCLGLRNIGATINNTGLESKEASERSLPENVRNNLVYQLNRTDGLPPVLDETSTGLTNALPDSVPRDLPGWELVLKTYGLCLVAEKLKIPVFVLTELPTH